MGVARALVRLHRCSSDGCCAGRYGGAVNPAPKLTPSLSVAVFKVARDETRARRWCVNVTIDGDLAHHAASYSERGARQSATAFLCRRAALAKVSA